jgi:predicted CXXCH cytochrome family protein
MLNGIRRGSRKTCIPCVSSAMIPHWLQVQRRGLSSGMGRKISTGAIKPNKYGIIKRGKARSCSVCHDPHGSSQSHNLIRTYSCEGVFCFTMTYYALEDGGKCMVGCHKPKSYHRTTSSAKSE